MNESRQDLPKRHAKAARLRARGQGEGRGRARSVAVALCERVNSTFCAREEDLVNGKRTRCTRTGEAKQEDPTQGED